MLCVAYRPDDTPLSFFEDTLKPVYIHALTMNKPIIILGDLNCSALDSTCREYVALVGFTREMNLQKLIKQPTRITATTESLLDIILVSDVLSVRRGGTIINPISDHLPVFVELKLKSPKPSPHYISARSYKNYDPDLFIIDLALHSDSLLSLFAGSDVNNKLAIFNNVFRQVLDAHAPVKTIKIRNRPCPFITDDIKELMKTRSETDWAEYKDYRNNVKRALMDAERKHTYQEVQSNKSNSRSLWKVINNVVPSKSQEKHVYSKDLKTVANDFNSYFSSVGSRAADAVAQLARDNNITYSNSSPLSPLRPALSTANCFSFSPVSCEVVRHVILSVPLNKAPGPDKIKAKVFRDSLQVVLGPITEIINCSFPTTTFPSDWKTAEVIPLLKAGDHKAPSNNRPLSLLNFASKVCEKIALEQFSVYLMSHKCLSSHQSGNKSLHSTETLNIYTTDLILESMDKKKMSALILLDLSKAFDSVSHQRLLQKLSAVGASPATVRWFQSYLTGRTQSVRIDSVLSDPLPITHGVPQGAILSPLLFSTHLNDLSGAPQFCQLESYVDDSKVLLFFPVNDFNDARIKLEEDLRKVPIWGCKNQLLINPDKTKFMLIGTRQLMSSHSVDLSYLVSSCLSKLVQINRVKKSFDKDILTLIISSLVFSKMFYCSSVWSNTSKNNIKKLQLIQNFACRIITGSQKYDHVTPLLHQLNWLSVNEILQLRDSVMAFKCVNNLAPDYLCIKFKKDHLFMIAQLVIIINFKSLYIRLLAVNEHLLIGQFLYGTL